MALKRAISQKKRDTDVRELGQRAIPSLKENLPYILNRVTSRLNLSFIECLRPLGLTMPRWRVLIVLMEQDGLSIGKLVEQTVITQAVLSRVIDQMERDDLVVRRSSSRDSRVVEIHLTAFGREVHRKIAPTALEHTIGLTSVLDVDERGQLLRLLTRLMEDGDENAADAHRQKTGAAAAPNLHLEDVER